MPKNIVFLGAHTRGGSLLLGCERYFLVLGHFENLMLFVPFLLYPLTSDHGYPYWPTGVSRKMRKSAENRPLQGNTFAGPQKTLKIADF